MPKLVTAATSLLFNRMKDVSPWTQRFVINSSLAILALTPIDLVLTTLIVSLRQQSYYVTIYSTPEQIQLHSAPFAVTSFV